MSQKKTIDRTVLVVGVVGSLALLNVIGVKVFGRLDLTRDKQFTLSKATVDVLGSLKDPVTVRAYFSSDLPAKYGANARYVKDLLDEYYNRGHGNFRYEFIDPAAEETEADKEKKKDLRRDIFGRAVRDMTSVERELQGLGIRPVQVQVNEADKFESKRAYMGIAITYGEKKEVIPVVQDTAGLEYDLTTLIRKMTRAKQPKVALIGGHEGLEPDKDLKRVWDLLGQNYALTTVDLTKDKEIPADVDAVLVVEPKTPFGDDEKRELDKFVMSGRGAAFLLGSVRPDLQAWQTIDLQPGLDDLLKAYGVELVPGLVVDDEAAAIPITQQRGPIRFTEQIKYPFIPVPKSLDPQHPLTRGIGYVGFPFMSPVSVAFADAAAVKADMIVKSSPRSWLQKPPYNLDPLQQWTADKLEDEGQKGLVVTLTGALKSYAGGEPAKNARILVAGGGSFVTDPFLSPGNEALVLNMVDWLVLDEALLSVRSRGLAAARLSDLGDAARATVKYLNIAGVPLALVAFGLVRWRMREKRRGSVSV